MDGRSRHRWICAGVVTMTVGCAAAPPAPAAAPCPTATSLTPADAQDLLQKLGRRIRLSPEEEALRTVRSLDDARAILRRDQALLFPAAIAYLKTQAGTEARIVEAQLETLLGESELAGAYILAMNGARVAARVNVARARIACDPARATAEMPRVLERLVASIEEGQAIAQALGTVAPGHVGRGAELLHAVAKEAPEDPRVRALVAEVHRFHGDWAELEQDLAAMERADPASPIIPYLRGVTAFSRGGDVDGAARCMREALARAPRFVRAQAALVMLAPTPADTARELDRLRELNESHYLLTLVAPSIAAEAELARP